MILKTLIYPNFSKSNAFECTVEAVNELIKYDFEVLMDNCYKSEFDKNQNITFGDFDELAENTDIIIAIGGDGTILRASVYAAKYKKLLLGINTGRLGFMASLERGELSKLSLLNEGKYTVDRRMMLEISLEQDNKIEKYTALNDAVISKSSFAKLPDFEIYCEGKEVNKVRSDGIVFSTPTGSTAYALSAGGPIIEPDVRCIEVTHICAHSLFARTMIFSAEKKLELICRKYDNNPVCLQVDGKKKTEIDNDSKLIITQSENYVDLIDINGSMFYRAIDEKLMMPIK